MQNNLHNTEDTPECFVAMWFGSDADSKAEMDQLFELVIQPAIESFNFKPYHVDRDDSADKLDDAILNAIDRAYLVIVDLTHDPQTGLRGSVLFEAGYAYRLKPVIWMCRDDLAENCAPFDTRQFRQVRWNRNKLIDAQKKLQNVIRARNEDRGKQRKDHEITRLITEKLHYIKIQEDISMPNDARVVADQVRLMTFEDLCDDLKTRIDYKDMGLSQGDKYELVEMIRGWMKFIQLFKNTKKVPDMQFYKNQVLPKLQATGWINS